MATNFETTEFEFAHGRKPRGRGSWAFAFDAGDSAPWFAPCPLTFTEAKKLARAEAKARGATTVKVLS